MPRRKPEPVATRVLPHEKARIRALAELEGVTVAEAVYRVLVPAVSKRLRELAACGPDDSAGPPFAA